VAYQSFEWQRIIPVLLKHSDQSVTKWSTSISIMREHLPLSSPPSNPAEKGDAGSSFRHMSADISASFLLSTARHSYINGQEGQEKRGFTSSMLCLDIRGEVTWNKVKRHLQ